jgi:hypothetical protein
MPLLPKLPVTVQEVNFDGIGAAMPPAQAMITGWGV